MMVFGSLVALDFWGNLLGLGMLPFFKELCQAEPGQSIVWKFETLRRDPFFDFHVSGRKGNSQMQKVIKLLKEKHDYSPLISCVGHPGRPLPRRTPRGG